MWQKSRLERDYLRARVLTLDKWAIKVDEGETTLGVNLTNDLTHRFLCDSFDFDFLMVGKV
jgi:hypothetical protein